jgi:hypothetical protein
MKKLNTFWSDRWRFVMHFPIGVITAFSWYYIGGIAWMLLAGFLAYEFIQDFGGKHDSSYKDIIGWLAGLFIGAGIIWLMIQT